MTKRIERVHVVFKTHLDIGFTDLAESVTQRYLTGFIPRAISTAAELRRRGGPERLVWTTGSWLIDACLSRAGAEERGRLEAAIAAGDIAWHALPFTTHTELMDEALCDYGLSLAAALDARFARRTIAAKLTDVPGHTLGLVPLLARRGVKYLHVGVNGSSKVPEVPRVFRWRAPGGEEVLVHYDGSYGAELAIDGVDEALAIVNGADNLGPPSAADVVREFKRLSEAFPGAEIVASTLDAFALRLLEAADRFPVVTEEIGDTWIHGVGSDPFKVSRYKDLLRLRSRWIREGRLDVSSREYRDFMGSLLMVPEHTWGLDFKKYLGDYKNWSVDDFAAARGRDAVAEDAVPDEFRFIDSFAEREFLHLHPEDAERRRRRTYSFFESSHAEQRAYLDAAEAALPEELRAEAAASCAALRPVCPASAKSAVPSSGDARGGSDEKLEAGVRTRIGAWSAVFGSDGSLSSLRDASGRELVAEGGGIGVYRYETFGAEDYAAWHRDYNHDMDVNASWALPDFGKPGMAYAHPRPEHRLYAPTLRSLRLVRGDDFDEVAAEASAGDDAPGGAPRLVVLRYRFPREGGKLDITLDWFDKEATRLPEALWLSFGLSVATPALWRMVKLGLPLAPLEVVRGGNRAYHAVEAVRYAAADGRVEVVPLDSPLLSIGERKLLRFDGRFADPAGGLHFNLYNNIWGTNFPLWYGEDGRTRFRLSIG